MKSFENLLPKLVIAPSFVLGFAFIYGLMIWNGVLSMTGSRMLPNYENFVGLDQYAALWEMDRWYVALKNLGIFSVLYVGGSMLVGMVLAIFLDQKIRAEGILRTMWLTRDELAACADRHRSPTVLQCVDEYLAGIRAPLALIQTHASVYKEAISTAIG